jgi:hypothetical protein
VDGIWLYKEAVFRYIAEKFGLAGKAKNGTVQIALTIDGAKLESKLCHVTIKLKLVDIDSIDPNTSNKENTLTIYSTSAIMCVLRDCFWRTELNDNLS